MFLYMIIEHGILYIYIYIFFSDTNEIEHVVNNKYVDSKKKKNRNWISLISFLEMNELVYTHILINIEFGNNKPLNNI